MSHYVVYDTATDHFLYWQKEQRYIWREKFIFEKVMWSAEAIKEAYYAEQSNRSEEMFRIVVFPIEVWIDPVTFDVSHYEIDYEWGTPLAKFLNEEEHFE